MMISIPDSQKQRRSNWHFQLCSKKKQLYIAYLGHLLVFLGGVRSKNDAQIQKIYMITFNVD